MKTVGMPLSMDSKTSKHVPCSATGETALGMEASSSVSPRHQRCLDAIAGRAVDRAPTYIPGIACSVASQILGRKAYTGTHSLHYAEVLAWWNGEAAHAEFEAQLSEDLLSIHRALDIDVYRFPWRMSVKPFAHPDENTFLIGDPDGDYGVWKYVPESVSFGMVEHHRAIPPTEDDLKQEVEKMEAWLAEESGTPPSLSAGYIESAQALNQEFFVPFNGGSIAVPLDEENLMAMLLEPELVSRKLMVQAGAGIRWAEALAASPLPKVMLGGGDMADNRGPVYSQACFQEVVLPAYRRLLGRCAELGVHYVFRTDGNLWPVADLLFGEAGCPGYGETDRDAGMTMGELRKHFPRLVVWGNVSSSLLQQGTARQVKEESRRILDESGGTGYFQGCSNAIIVGTPPENVEAMFSVR
ncbi:MAG: uroporphyrinogen decarboxylase family protein [Verrucomicrobiota bacterium]